jgi:hypothetical protein
VVTNTVLTNRGCRVVLPLEVRTRHLDCEGKVITEFTTTLDANSVAFGHDIPRETFTIPSGTARTILDADRKHKVRDRDVLRPPE